MTATSLTGVRLGHFYELVVHLARRELSSQHRGTLLGWAWPLTRQLAQLAVLVFVFSSLFDLDIENYPVFVFTGCSRSAGSPPGCRRARPPSSTSAT